ncbi:anion exchange protein 2, slc4a2 [Culex quinquefasciatus]|uniref:Anion exchange protein 2, slc4a2 n=1 Tax=Culex quinquefasciatus TaxID=7176 RepID=B0XJ84_CULQU|nr:anion exchange protein 2, slc4a2 [Culex quinquefasciatus]|eukprot:XP_001869706.1 anion exchange protein 2, slc4a2 [Culex quinquefasciatus]
MFHIFRSDENKKHYMDVWLGEDFNDLARATEDEEADDRVLNISPLPDEEFSNDTSISLPLEIRVLPGTDADTGGEFVGLHVPGVHQYADQDCAVVSYFMQTFGSIVRLATLIPVVPQLRTETFTGILSTSGRAQIRIDPRRNVARSYHLLRLTDKIYSTENGVVAGEASCSERVRSGNGRKRPVGSSTRKVPTGGVIPKCPRCRSTRLRRCLETLVEMIDLDE